MKDAKGTEPPGGNKMFGKTLVHVFLGSLAGTLLSACSSAQAPEVPSATQETAMKSLYEFQMNDIDGKPVKLETYQGKVLLLVNVASKCGFTPQYEGLQALYSRFKNRGFEVLGFPANNFMGQEPGTNEEIKQFCSLKYHVTFPMFEKISVKGEDQHPLYTYLTSEATNPGFAGEISWNFNKFLADRTGKIVARFGSRTKPEDPEVIEAIEKALGEKKSE